MDRCIVYLVRLFIFAVWFVDVFNFPQFECLDTTYPINFWGWVVIGLFIPTYENLKDSSNKKNEFDTNNICCNDCNYKKYYMHCKNRSKSNRDNIVDAKIID